MPITPASIAVAAGLEVQAIFRDGLSVLVSGEPQYLVDGAPESVSGAISQAAGRSACRIYGTGAIDLPPRAAERYERTCRPYLDSIGQGEGPKLGSPFEGGQCDGELYTFVVSVLSPSSGNRTTFARIGWGPIGTPSLVPQGSQQAVQITTRGQGPGTSCDNPPDLLASATATTFGSIATSRTDPKIDSITKCTGSDGCGSVPPEVTDPVPDPDPDPPPFRFNPGPNIDIDIDVDLNVDGSITFNIGTGPITIDPFTDNPFDPGGGGGDGGGGGGDDGPSDGPAGDPGTPGTPVETGDDGEAEEEAPPGNVLVGLMIDILESPPGANEFRPGVFRGAAYIYMGTPGVLDQDFGGSMIRSGQFFFAEKDNLTVWEVNANIGFRLRVTPYYREVD